MVKDDFKNVLQRYIEDGFSQVEFELKGGGVLFFNAEEDERRFLNDYFEFSRTGLEIRVYYEVIECIAI